MEKLTHRQQRRIREAAERPVRGESESRCPDCWNGKTIPCAVGCREWDECCNKRLDVPCERCGGTGWMTQLGYGGLA